MSNEDEVREQIKRIHVLIQATKERVATLRPIWSAYLAVETLNNLGEAVDELDKTVAAGRNASLDLRRTG